MYECMNVWMYVWMNERMNEWTNENTLFRLGSVTFRLLLAKKNVYKYLPTCNLHTGVFNDKSKM